MPPAVTRRAQIERYIALPWTWRCAWDDEAEAYVVSIAELPDYFAAGETDREAWGNARDALYSLLDAYLTRGITIPAPPAPAFEVTSVFIPVESAVAVARSGAERSGDGSPEYSFAYA